MRISLLLMGFDHRNEGTDDPKASKMSLYDIERNIETYIGKFS